MKNILIIKPSSLGDIVLALPALSALHNSFPNAKISWMVRPEFAPLLKNHPYLTETILFDRNFLGKAWYNPKAFAALISLIRLLRGKKYDAVIDLQGLFRTAFLAWLSGCRNRFGMRETREFASLFYTCKVTQNSDCIHLVDYYMKIVEAAGGRNHGIQFVLPVDTRAADAVNRLLANNNIDRDGYVVFAPISARPNKCWPVEQFAALADKIMALAHLPIVVVGTKAERYVADKIRSCANVPIIDFAGKTSVSELVALIKSARLVVSNDTGAGHIAAALNKPLVMIFGPTNPARVCPYGRKNCVAAVEPDDRGMYHTSFDPRHDIKLVTVENVFHKVCEQLEHG